MLKKVRRKIKNKVNNAHGFFILFFIFKHVVVGYHMEVTVVWYISFKFKYLTWTLYHCF